MNLRLPEKKINKVITIDRARGKYRVSVLCDDTWHQAKKVTIFGACEVVNGDILTMSPVMLNGVTK